MMEFNEWNGFEKGEWKRQIDVRNFIQKNYTPYEGDSSFLKGTTEKTQKLWNKVLELYKKEHDSEGGVLDIDTETISTIASHDAGYIDKELEEIVGLQTDAPLKRAIMPFGGIKIVEKSCGLQPFQNCHVRHFLPSESIVSSAGSHAPRNGTTAPARITEPMVTVTKPATVICGSR